MHLIYALFLQLGRLPTNALYPIADMTSFILARVVRYRRGVITKNFAMAFPDADRSTVRALRRRFYRNLGEWMIETIRLPHMSPEEVRRRVTFANPEVLSNIALQGENTIIMMPHSGNWEWAGAATQLTFSFTLAPIYRRVKAPFFDAWFLRLRSKFGAIPVLDKDAPRVIPGLPAPHAVVMLADQRPAKKGAWWGELWGIPTSFFRGSEVLSNRLGYRVVFAFVERQNRGQYLIHLEEVPLQKERYALTNRFIAFMEAWINQQPENWLWSHKRFKHQPEDGDTWMG